LGADAALVVTPVEASGRCSGSFDRIAAPSDRQKSPSKATSRGLFTVPGLFMTSIRSDAAGEGSPDSFLDVNACGVE
jgi:hypothetical protein